MTDNKYLPRIIDSMIADRLSWKGAVCVEGAKWCGKTRSCLEQARSTFLVGNPEGNYANRNLAELNPLLALQGDTPHLIDEWQEVPSLWDAVRMEVDKRSENGQFILTGSSSPRKKSTTHSGTGRITKLRMRSMSLFESCDSSGSVSIHSLFDNTFEDCLTGDVELIHLAELIVRGGWPGILGYGEHAYIENGRDYIRSFLTEDLMKLDDDKVRRDVRKIEYLLVSLARNESTTITVAGLCRDIKAATNTDIKEDTVNEYLNLLERSFLIENQEPFTFSSRSSRRLKLAPKRHMTDPSLSCALLSLTPAKLMKDLETFGFMFEALAERDLAIYSTALNGRLGHYQDYGNKEIDAVLELDDGRWGAFEIKLGANQIDKAAESLLNVSRLIKADNPDNAPSFLAVICGLSNAAYRRKDGVYVLPLTALKP